MDKAGWIPSAIWAGHLHVICLPHIRQDLTALMNRLCEKLQSHLRGCFGVSHPKRLVSKRTMKEACRVPASIASWPLREISIQAGDIGQNDRGRESRTHGRLHKSRHYAWNAWKTSNFCDSYVPYPGHFGRCRRLEWISLKDHNARLAGTRHASFMMLLPSNLFG